MGNMEQYANPDSESRAVGDHAIPAVEEVMTDERLCTCPLYIQTVSQFTCPAHGLVRNGEPVEAAPSTDEGEARYWTPISGGVVMVAPEVVAAIRAPLEERIQNMQREMEETYEDLGRSHGVVQHWQARAEVAEERIRELEALLRGSGTQVPD